MWKARPTSFFSASAGFVTILIVTIALNVGWATVNLDVRSLQDPDVHHQVMSVWKLQKVSLTVPELHESHQYTFNEITRMSGTTGSNQINVVKQYSLMAFDTGIATAICCGPTILSALVSWYHPDYSGKFYFRLTGLSSLIGSVLLISGSVLYSTHITDALGVWFHDIGDVGGPLAASYLEQHTKVFLSLGFYLFVGAGILLFLTAFANFFVRLPVYFFQPSVEDTMAPMTDSMTAWIPQTRNPPSAA